jgi:hypothetical protein
MAEAKEEARNLNASNAQAEPYDDEDDEDVPESLLQEIAMQVAMSKTP